MENFKSTFFSLLFVLILAFIGIWAFSTIESGSAHVNQERQKLLEAENKQLTKEIAELNSKISLLESQKINEVKPEEVVNPEPEVKKPIENTPVLKYQTLINEIQKLVDSNVYLKVGSRGAPVGSVQKFLNVYNGTSSKIDNDYGATTKTAIIKFQKDQGITADGEVGPGTFKKMIEYLKKK